MPKKTMDLRQPGDSRLMSQTIAWCAAQGLPVRRVSPYQLKIGVFNFYPDKGTHNRDDLPAKKVGGFPAFKDAVLRWWEAENAQFKQSL
ncbi:MAG TPA: hypothetical protein VM735_07435 [Candidatus Kapabacteria bacterium]|jgi:hypothetical protein|nr:hypothetical protein [Candidatus Kapabacteria bacterium]